MITGLEQLCSEARLKKEGSREDLEHLPVPKEAPRELERNSAQGHEVMEQEGDYL